MKITDESKPGGFIQVSRIEIPQAIKDAIAQRIDDELPKCNHCDTTLKPERIGAGRYVCPCCAREFRG